MVVRLAPTASGTPHDLYELGMIMYTAVLVAPNLRIFLFSNSISAVSVFLPIFSLGLYLIFYILVDLIFPEPNFITLPQYVSV